MVEEIPSYRYCVYRRRDPRVSQIDARTDRGTYIDKLEEVRQDSAKKLENIRSVMAGWKVKGKVRFVEWVAAPVLGTALDSPVTGQKVELQVLHRVQLDCQSPGGDREGGGGGRGRCN